MNIIKNSDGSINITGLTKEQALAAINQLYTYVPAQTRQNNSNQRRDAKGRFEKKVWVAHFTYPDSRHSWLDVKRTVITQNSERAKPALFWRDDSIEGVDLSRGAFRKFIFGKVSGPITWTKEYASDVKAV